MRTPEVPVEDFIVAWMTATNIHDVVRATGMRATAAYNRAAYLRKKGIDLKRFTSGIVSHKTFTASYIAELNVLANRYRQDRKP